MSEVVPWPCFIKRGEMSWAQNQEVIGTYQNVLRVANVCRAGEKMINKSFKLVHDEILKKKSLFKNTGDSGAKDEIERMFKSLEGWM